MINKILSGVDMVIDIVTSAFQLAAYFLVSVSASVYLVEHQNTIAYILHQLTGGQ